MDATRLGLNVNRDTWPTPASLRGLEAAGFGAVQIHTPPPDVLRDRENGRRHARALREVLHGCGLQLVLHGPDDLSLGSATHDQAMAGLLDYAAQSGAGHVVYHGLNHTGGSERIRLEEVSLSQAARRAEALGVTIAVENLAPVWPGAVRLCHDPRVVRDFARRIASPAVGVLLDIGHAHITTSARGGDLAETVEELLDAVVLFHVHDNLGARRHHLAAPGVDPLKLDLHLPPGSGTLPWDKVAPLLEGHTAIAMLEIERSHLRSGPFGAARAIGAHSLQRLAAA